MVVQRAGLCSSLHVASWLFGMLLVGLLGCGARTGLSPRATDPDALLCPTLPYVTQPGVAVRVYASVPEPSTARSAWSLVSSPAGSHATLSLPDNDSVVVVADTVGDYTFEIRTVYEDAGMPAADCTVTVAVRAQGPAAICPSDVTTSPGVQVALSGVGGGDPDLSSEAWTLLSAPDASGWPQPVPQHGVRTHFTPDVVGDFVLQFTVTDPHGAMDTCTTTVHAVVHDGLRVEMYWNPPGQSCPSNPRAACDASDLDLHLLRASGGSGWGTDDDCYWYNCDAEAMRMLTWPGPSGASPQLDHDIVNGHGPENTTVHTPTEHSYRIGVHYFDGHGAADEAATVLVYCNADTPVATLGPVTMHNQGGAAANDFWMVADVLPTGDGGCTVQPIEADGEALVVTYQAAMMDAGPPAP